MSEKNVMRLVRAVVAHEIKRAPKQHPLRTPQCPPLTRLGQLSPGWTAAEQEHMATCPYCRMLLRLEESEAAECEERRVDSNGKVEDNGMEKTTGEREEQESSGAAERA
jgi:hypothetical protein